MKIIAGQLKGKPFFMPHGIRPTQSLVCKSLFDMLGQTLEGNFFCDLCSGSGSVAFEALSRDASQVVFVEKHEKAVRVIRENLDILLKGTDGSLARRCEILQMDMFLAIKTLAKREMKFHLVYLDPPYERGMTKKALKTLGAYDILHRSSRVIIQHHRNERLPECSGFLTRCREKKYGSTVLSFYQKNGDANPKSQAF